MNLSSILHRQLPPQPWCEGEKIPWNEPGFSRRMLQEHLTQDHDRASRRLATIERHVEWIHQHLLQGHPGKVLDLGCGPGLYLNRLARLGHQGTGIDFSPASIAYAIQTSEGLPVEYREADLRKVDFGSDYDLVMFIFGELNAFHPDNARLILQKAFTALKPGGHLLLEVSALEALRRGVDAPSWFTSHQGLFSDRPHILLSESFWDEMLKTVTERYFVIDIETGNVTRMTASTQAYTDQDYQRLLEDTGYHQVEFHADLSGSSAQRSDFFPITAQKPSKR